MGKARVGSSVGVRGGVRAQRCNWGCPRYTHGAGSLAAGSRGSRSTSCRRSRRCRCSRQGNLLARRRRHMLHMPSGVTRNTGPVMAGLEGEASRARPTPLSAHRRCSIDATRGPASLQPRPAGAAGTPPRRRTRQRRRAWGARSIAGRLRTAGHPHALGGRVSRPSWGGCTVRAPAGGRVMASE